MSSTLIKDNPAQELARLSATNFFANKPADVTKSEWLYLAAKREAARWGADDYLASHYFRMAAYARLPRYAEVTA